MPDLQFGLLGWEKKGQTRWTKGLMTDKTGKKDGFSWRNRSLLSRPTAARISWERGSEAVKGRAWGGGYTLNTGPFPYRR